MAGSKRLLSVVILGISSIAGAADGGLAPSRATVAGRVIDTNDTPVAGARLTLRDWDERGGGGGHHAEATSDAGGRFALQARVGTSRLLVQADGFASMYRTHDVMAGMNGGWDFTLLPSARVTGWLRDTKGRVVAGRMLELVPVRAAPPPAPGVAFRVEGGAESGRVGANGAFDLRNVAPGAYAIIVYHPSPIGGDRCMQQVPVSGRLLQIAAGARVEGHEIVIEPAEDYAISGHVSDAAGNPVSNVFIAVQQNPHGRHWWTKSGQDGAFRIEGLDGIGTPTVTVNFGGDGSLCMPGVPVNAENVALVFPGKGGVDGTVLDGQTGRGAPVFDICVTEVRLADGRTFWRPPRATVTTGTNGAFRLSNVLAGLATVEVRARGLGVQRFMARVAAGKTERLECSMRGPAVLEGRTTLDGKPHRTNVILDGEWVYSDASGCYRFDNHPNGDYVVWFFGGEGWHRTAPVRLESGAATRLDMELGGSCRIRGTVVFPGEEASCCTVRLAAQPARGGWADGRPNPEDSVLAISWVRQSGQSYDLKQIPPGRYWLMAGLSFPYSYRSKVVFCREVELVDGQELTINLK